MLRHSNILILAFWLVVSIFGSIAVIASEKFESWGGLSLYLVSCMLGLIASIIATKLTNIKKIVAFISLTILSFGYLLKYPFYEVYNNYNSSSLNSSFYNALFPEWTLEAHPRDMTVVMGVVFAGYVGVLIAILFGRVNNKKSVTPKTCTPKNKKPIIGGQLFYFGLLLFAASSLLRIKYNLVMGEESTALAYGMGGIIVITNTFLSPAILIYSFIHNQLLGNMENAKNQAAISLIIGIIQYLLFYSKGAIFMPIFAIMISQIAIGKLFSKKTLLTVALITLFLYPFLNIYRWVSMAGKNNLIDLLNAVGMHSEVIGLESMSDQIVIGFASLWGRVVGLDSLVVLIDAGQNWNVGMLDFLFSNIDLDDYLTYNILGFSTSMGVSPGHLGRVFFITNSYIIVAFSAFIMTFIPMQVLKAISCAGSIKFRPIAYILTFYTLQLQISGFRIDVFQWWLFTIACLVAITSMKLAYHRHRHQ
jgi:hypothetical protein